MWLNSVLLCVTQGGRVQPGLPGCQILDRRQNTEKPQTIRCGQGGLSEGGDNTVGIYSTVLFNTIIVKKKAFLVCSQQIKILSQDN